MFKKLGLLRLPPDRPAWMHSHIYIPNAFLLDDGTIRIIAAFWDDHGIGRIGYLDTLVDDPFHVIRHSTVPALDIGAPGCFDDNGVSPLCLVPCGDTLRLYYAGWQLSDKVRYLLFTGIAESRDRGAHFHRIQQVPILDRCEDERTVRTGGFVYKSGETWSMVYAGGSATVLIDGKQVPTYELRSVQSSDGIHWPGRGVIAISPDQTNGEFGFGRPYILREGDTLRMWYGIRGRDRGYSLGYAESPASGRPQWLRQDHCMETFNEDDFPHDRQMRAFPTLVATARGTLVFYNGDHYGREGLCVAQQL